MSPLTESGAAVETKTTTEAEPKGTTVDDILKSFKEGEEETEDKTNLLADDKGESDESDKETKSKSEDSEDEGREEDLVTPVSVKKIEEAYPDIFKKFPFLKAAYQRDHQFVEIFPTVEDAKEAAGNSETYQRFSNDLFAGKIDSVFKSLSAVNKESFNNLVDNLLPALHSVDEKAYYHLIGNTTKNLIASMVKEARASENEDLGRAAIMLHQFMFGKSEFEEPKNYGKGNQKNEQEQNQDKFLQERFEAVSEDVDRVSTNAIRSTIALNIDPDGKMSEYVKKNAIKDAMEFVEESIRQDRSTSAQITKLWDAAARNNFNRNSLEQIKRVYLGKAKTVLRDAIKKARAEALKSGTRAKTSRDEDSSLAEDKPITTPRRIVENRSSNPRDKYKGMSTRQVLDLD